MARKILFTSKHCGACAGAKRVLNENGVKYREVSVDTERGEKLANKHDVRILPTLMVDGRKVPVSRWLN